MGTIANKLAKLKTTKAEIKAALEEAGQSVGDVFDTYPAAIRAVVSSGTKISTGSYVGTGTYGESNPNSLTFEFAPKLLFMTMAKNPEVKYFYDLYHVGCNPLDCTILNTEYQENIGFYDTTYNNYSYAKKSADGKTINWYSKGKVSDQLNELNYRYYYFAIG
jgi:hypothetical protein